MRTLALALFDSGIVQFGQFHTEQSAAPMRFDVGMLASYPVALSLLAERVAASLQLPDEARLCCALDTLPAAVLIGQIKQIPIVYSPQREDEPPQAFIGAYDIGHPATLLWSWPPSLREVAWAAQMERVGLQLANEQHLLGDHRAALDITELLDVLVSEKRIRPVQAETCLHWYHTKIRPS